MADILGFPEDPAHWNKTINFDRFDIWLENMWEVDTPSIFGPTINSVGQGNINYAAMSMFPREWAVEMAEVWLNNPVDGFYGPVPLTTIAMKDFAEDNVSKNFAVTPDANWHMLRGLYMHNVDSLANKFTLEHLKKYNMEWGIPVAPEARKNDWSPHGDQYSNFNAGKILLILEGIGGLRYSTHEDSFTFSDNLPVEWSFMEFRVPVQKSGEAVQWVRARSEREQDGELVTKTVIVEGNPFKNLVVRPWLEDGVLETAFPSDGQEDSPQEGHGGWKLEASEAEVVMVIRAV